MATKPEGNAAVVETPVAPAGGDDVAAIMRFDPFAPPKAGPQEATPQEESKTSDATPPAEKVKGAAAPGKDATPAAPKPEPPAAPAPATPAAPATDFQKLFREQTDAIKALVTPPAEKAPDKPAAPKFNVGIPPQILDAMSSEDPQERATATHALVNGVANLIWNEVSAHLKAELGTLMQGIPQVIEAHSQARATQQQVFQDFYGAHQNLNKPEFQPLVLSAAQAVFQDWQQAGKAVAWNAELRDAIAEKIYAAIPALRPAAAAKPNGATPPPAKPRFVTGANATPSSGAAGPESDMLAVLGLRQ